MLRIAYLLTAGLVVCLAAGGFLAVKPTTASISAYGTLVSADR